MALRNAILAVLLDTEASGYDLAKFFDASVANFWTSTPQQIYRELEKKIGRASCRERV
jgi:DNA-binding PadR family transcriptional regulator